MGVQQTLLVPLQAAPDIAALDGWIKNYDSTNWCQRCNWHRTKTSWLDQNLLIWCQQCNLYQTRPGTWLDRNLLLHLNNCNWRQTSWLEKASVTNSSPEDEAWFALLVQHHREFWKKVLKHERSVCKNNQQPGLQIMPSRAVRVVKVQYQCRSNSLPCSRVLWKYSINANLIDYCAVKS